MRFGERSWRLRWRTGAAGMPSRSWRDWNLELARCVSAQRLAASPTRRSWSTPPHGRRSRFHLRSTKERIRFSRASIFRRTETHGSAEARIRLFTDVPLRPERAGVPAGAIGQEGAPHLGRSSSNDLLAAVERLAALPGPPVCPPGRPSFAALSTCGWLSPRPPGA